MGFIGLKKAIGVTSIAAVLAGAAWLTVGAPAKAVARSRGRHVAPVLNFTMKSLGGRNVRLSKYQGKVILIVNTASKCGFTPQYAGLEKLYKKYHKKGLVILGFPENDFDHQEPGTDKQISVFCTKHFGVTFPMFSKVDVKGPNKCPLYQFLTEKKTDPHFAGTITWNFNKFIISRSGKIVARFPSPVTPLSPLVVGAIKKQLAKH